MNKFLYCLNYVSNHQWSPWKQLSSGSRRSSVQEQRLGVLMNPLKTRGANILLSGMTALGCGQEPLPMWALSPAAPFTHERAGWVGGNVPDKSLLPLYNTHKPKVLPGRLTSWSTPSTQSKPCPMDVPLPTNCCGQSHLTTPRADCSKHLGRPLLGQRCKATSLQRWAHAAWLSLQWGFSSFSKPLSRENHSQVPVWGISWKFSGWFRLGQVPVPGPINCDRGVAIEEPVSPQVKTPGWSRRTSVPRKETILGREYHSCPLQVRCTCK